MLDTLQKGQIIQSLERIVGSEYVSTNPADLYIYSRDMTIAEPVLPDIVAIPGSVEEIQAILSLANEYALPVTSCAAGGNIGGL
ncbi:MAG: hypothetical protein NUV31_06375, partial [Dehalococcoidales bacterium]|nr:hypothetical protein [Dehalococcoidales bacterium]